MMHVPILIIAFLAQGLVLARRIVAHGTEDGSAKQAAAATDKLIGISTAIDTDDGKHLDVIREGLANVTYGGTIAAGDAVTSDAQGRAVVAASGNEVIGYAEVSGVENDIGSIQIVPGVAQ